MIVCSYEVRCCPKQNSSYDGGHNLGGPVATSKLLGGPYSHVKVKSVIKACRTDMPYVCWEEH